VKREKAKGRRQKGEGKKEKAKGRRQKGEGKRQRRRENSKLKTSLFHHPTISPPHHFSAHRSHFSILLKTGFWGGCG
jgi:hypothetical protein